MTNRFMKGFIVISLGFIFGCGGMMQKTKSFIQSPFGEKKEISELTVQESKENHLKRGKRLFMNDDMKGALTEFEAAVSEEANSPEAHYSLGLTYFELNKYFEAIREYEKAIQLKPNFAEAHFNLGVAYDQFGQEGKALQAYKKAKELGIDDAALHFNMGLSLLRLSRFEEAKRENLRALELEPNLAEAYNNLGYLAETAGDLDEAIVQYKKALAIKSDYEIARENLGRLEKIPVVTPPRPPVARKELLKQLYFEMDGKWITGRDVEFKIPSSTVEVSSQSRRALFRIGYNPVKRIDLFLHLGLTDLSFDSVDYLFQSFERIIGFAYGGGLNADMYVWDDMKLGFDGGIKLLTGSNEDEYKGGVKATADWTEYALSIRTRYLGYRNLVPYGGFSFSSLDGTFKLETPVAKQESDFNESNSLGIFFGGNYYYGDHLRFQAEARLLDETALAFNIKYAF